MIGNARIRDLFIGEILIAGCANTVPQTLTTLSAPSRASWIIAVKLTAVSIWKHSYGTVTIMGIDVMDQYGDQTLEIGSIRVVIVVFNARSSRR